MQNKNPTDKINKNPTMVPNENQTELTLGPKKPRIEDFDLHETIGTGSYSRVRLCKHKASARLVAIKIIKKRDIVLSQQIEHISSERSILSRLDHPFIVKFVASFQDTMHLYVVMELVIGGEIFFHLRNSGRFSNETTRNYVSQVTLALSYLHEQDILYRDLKPENLILDEKGYIKLVDFGFSKEVKDRTWTLCGTSEYLAPEVIQSKGHGKGADWWALGILIYEMLAGYPPFYDDNPFGIYQKILLGKVEFPRHFDAQAKDLIRKLVNVDASKRFGTLKGRADDVQKHKWFKGMDWEKMLRKEIPPPIVPEVRHPADTRNFEVYSEVAEDNSPQVVEQTALFDQF